MTENLKIRPPVQRAEDVSDWKVPHGTDHYNLKFPLDLYGLEGEALSIARDLLVATDGTRDAELVGEDAESILAHACSLGILEVADEEEYKRIQMQRPLDPNDRGDTEYPTTFAMYKGRLYRSDVVARAMSKTINGIRSLSRMAGMTNSPSLNIALSVMTLAAVGIPFDEVEDSLLRLKVCAEAGKIKDVPGVGFIDGIFQDYKRQSPYCQAFASFYPIPRDRLDVVGQAREELQEAIEQLEAAPGEMKDPRSEGVTEEVETPPYEDAEKDN